MGRGVGGDFLSGMGGRFRRGGSRKYGGEKMT